MGGKPSTINPDTDLLDLHGKVAIVTGATAGIGFWNAAHLSKRGAKVYIAARNESKATGAISRIEAWNPSPNRGPILFHKLELDDPRDAKKSAEAFLARESRLDILINNAGQMSSAYEKTKDGVVTTMAINHLSPFVFTNTLSPLLEKTAREPGSDVRVISVSSYTHSMVSDAKFDSLEEFNKSYEGTGFLPPAKMKRYAMSKLANILWTNELQRRYNEKNIPISFITIHPGGVLTETALDQLKALPLSGLVTWIAGFFSDQPEQGSFTTLFAAASPLIKQNPSAYRGKYISPYTKVEEPSPSARDPNLAKTLWLTSEKILKDVYGL
ncbi:hypothetical protein QCA50_001442 [Cerrena zonata]|uniref:Uncharacterized protein n=1 Tax=Cerrena zonata TaxID=2478898 RepID=A0AAW0GQS2_9APHY